MSLRARIALSIIALALGVVLVLGLVTQLRVIRPLANDARGAFAAQAVYVANRVMRGDDVETLESTFDVQVEQVTAPPANAHPLPERRRGRVRPGRAERGRVLASPHGPELYVRTRDGWLQIRPDLDLERPGRTLLRALVVVTLLLVLAALAIAAASVRPLHSTRIAMERVASGDLEHRLPETGASEITALARSFNRMTQRVQTLVRSEQDLLAGVSHELRTPISRLRLAVELLRDHDLPTRHLDGMEGDLEELEALIAELLEVSRLQIGESPLSVGPVDLHAIAVRVAEQDPRVVVTGQPSRLTGDARLLERALDNVVRNALAYAPDGPVEISVDADGWQVADRGPGVPAQSLSRLFEPFYRVDRSRSRATGGTGVGLRIVQHIAELHGGEASARLREGGGLVIQLVLRSVPVDGSR